MRVSFGVQSPERIHCGPVAVLGGPSAGFFLLVLFFFLGGGGGGGFLRDIFACAGGKSALVIARRTPKLAWAKLRLASNPRR